MSAANVVYQGQEKSLIVPEPESDRLWLRFSDQDPQVAQACILMSALLFQKLEDVEFWKFVSVSPALHTFRSDWLDGRWRHLIYCHVFSEHGAPTHFQSVLNS